MKGFLTFLILWIVYKKPGSGQDIAREIEKRKGEKPSPGTLYPVLKDLTARGAIKSDGKAYAITPAGNAMLHDACDTFKQIFYDVDEICTCKH